MALKKEIFNLDECVIQALEMLDKAELPKVKFQEFKQPLIVGNGNAFVTGKILFNDVDAVFADISSYLSEIGKRPLLDGAVLISASGEKQAPVIARDLRQHGLKTLLFTNNPDSAARESVDESYIFPKNLEPYTYNTSTYLSMIYAKTGEKPKETLKAIDKLKARIPKNLKKFDSFFFILPEQYDVVGEMFLTKFDELFGGFISARAYTLGQTKHAKTIVPSDKELFVSLGVNNKVFGKNRFFIPIDETIHFGGLVALGYYFIGKIQGQNPPYYKKNIEQYVKLQSKLFGEKIGVWQ